MQLPMKDVYYEKSECILLIEILKFREFPVFFCFKKTWGKWGHFWIFSWQNNYSKNRLTLNLTDQQATKGGFDYLFWNWNLQTDWIAGFDWLRNKSEISSQLCLYTSQSWSWFETPYAHKSSWAEACCMRSTTSFFPASQRANGVRLKFTWTTWKCEFNAVLSLNRWSSAQSDIKITHGWYKHGQQGKAIDTDWYEKCGRSVAIDQADNAVKGPERSQDWDKCQCTRWISGT